MAKTKDKFSGAASNVRPYVERAVSDAELRDNVKAAFVAARDVYDELLGNRGVTTVATRVATDKDIQDKLKEALDELRTAADRVQGKRTTADATRRSSSRASRSASSSTRSPGLPRASGSPMQSSAATTSRTRRRRATATARRTHPRPRSPESALADRLVSSAGAAFAGTGAMARRSDPGSRPLALEMSEI